MEPINHRMTENDKTPEIGFTMETVEVEADALTLLSVVREDLQNQIATVLDANDAHAHILVSVVNNGVFVACIIENKNGEFRYGDITPTSVLELWKLKTRQYTPEKGAWFSVQFTSAYDGFITKTSYNYDQQVFSGNTPENWYVAPVEETELYKSPWTAEQYQEDLAAFPRQEDKIPSWLK
jgi:hypothetical protein